MRAAEKTRSKLQKLIELFAGKAYLLIVIQDNPDPDSIASAVALRKLANSLANLQCSIGCSGTVGLGGGNCRGTCWSGLPHSLGVPRVQAVSSLAYTRGLDSLNKQLRHQAIADNRGRHDC